MALLGYLLMRFNKLVGGIVVGRGVSIDEGFMLMHTVGVVFNGKATIGKRCIVHGAVVVGAKNRLSPSIGDDVEIGSGAKILGDVHVGNGAVIGANAVIVRDVEEGCIVVGVPGEVRKRR